MAVIGFRRTWCNTIRAGCRGRREMDWIGAKLTEWTVDPLFCVKAAKTNAYGLWFRYLAI